MADDGQDVLVGDDVAGVGDTHIGLGLVVEGHELDLEPHLFERSLELVDGELRTELDALAERRLAARERALRRDLDGSLALRVDWRRAGHERDGGDQTEGEDGKHTAGGHKPLLGKVGFRSAHGHLARGHYNRGARKRGQDTRAAAMAARKLRVAASGSGAAHTAEITATPSAPARMTSPTFADVMPPMPTRGARISPRSFRTRSGPTSSKSGLVAVGNMEPTAT